MIHLYHGENIAASRHALQQLLEKNRRDGAVIHRLIAKKLTPATLEESVGSSALFPEEKVILIEEIHSLPRSKKKTALIQAITEASKQQNNTIILWEKRQLTATMLKAFPDANIQLFKLKKSLFSWLDAFGINTKKAQESLEKSLEQEDAYLCFILLIRRIRNLVYSVNGGTPKVAPFMATKLQRQAQAFDHKTLIALHTSLYLYDRRVKQGKAILTTEQVLQLVTSGTYSF